MKINNRMRLPLLMILVLFLFLFSLLNQSIFLFSLIDLILMYAIASLSWDILAGYTGYLSFAHTLPFGIGAYTTALLLGGFGLSPFMTAPLAGLVAAGVVVAFGYPMLRLRGVYFAFGTIFVNLTVFYAFTVLPFTGGALGVILPIPSIDPLNMERIFYVAFLLLAVGTAFLVYKISRSKFAIGCGSIREDEDACGALGVNATRVKLQAYALSCIPQGIMGGLYSYYNLYIDPATAFGSIMSFFPIMMTLVGGTRTIAGPIFGAVFFITLSQMLRFSLGISYAGLDMVIFTVILLVVFMTMREGIVGRLKKFSSLKSLF